jgi:probable HAF family extracellular repeat protein
MRCLVLHPLVLALLSTVGTDCFAGPIEFTTISYPGARATAAEAVNTGGSVVGSYDDTSGNTHGFLLAGVTFTTLDYPGADATFAKGINGAGTIVGDTVIASVDLGFLFSGGLFSPIAFPGADSTDAAAINSAGIIAGTYVTGGTANGFVYSGGIFTPLAVRAPTTHFPGGSMTPARSSGPSTSAGRISGSSIAAARLPRSLFPGPPIRSRPASTTWGRSPASRFQRWVSGYRGQFHTRRLSGRAEHLPQGR